MLFDMDMSVSIITQQGQKVKLLQGFFTIVFLCFYISERSFFYIRQFHCTGCFTFLFLYGIIYVYEITLIAIPFPERI